MFPTTCPSGPPSMLPGTVIRRHFIGLGAGLLFFATVVGATVSPLRTAFAAVPGSPPLHAVLESAALPWVTSQQGPLLVVDPQKTPLLPKAVPVGERDRLSLRAVAARYGRKVVPVGSLTVLAPTEMYVLNVPAKLPEDVAPFHNDKLRLLLASLTPEQWRQIASPEGLAVSDLDPRGQRWAQSLMPEAVRETFSVAHPGPKRPLTGAQKAGARLRLNRDTRIKLRYESQQLVREFDTWEVQGASRKDLFVPDTPGEEEEGKPRTPNRWLLVPGPPSVCVCRTV